MDNHKKRVFYEASRILDVDCEISKHTLGIYNNILSEMGDYDRFVYEPSISHILNNLILYCIVNNRFLESRNISRLIDKIKDTRKFVDSANIIESAQTNTLVFLALAKISDKEIKLENNKFIYEFLKYNIINFGVGTTLFGG